MPIESLASHPRRYVTVAELAEYWSVSQKQIRKHIRDGAVEAIRLGPRLYRVHISAAIEFERHATLSDGVRPRPEARSTAAGLPRLPVGQQLPLTFTFTHVDRTGASASPGAASAPAARLRLARLRHDPADRTRVSDHRST